MMESIIFMMISSTQGLASLLCNFEHSLQCVSGLKHRKTVGKTVQNRILRMEAPTLKLKMTNLRIFSIMSSNKTSNDKKSSELFRA